MTLADAFAREASLPGEARFYLAELALTLNRVKPKRAAEGGLSANTITELLLLAKRELEVQALALPSTSDTAMLDKYAKEAFSEAVRQ